MRLGCVFWGNTWCSTPRMQNDVAGELLVVRSAVKWAGRRLPRSQRDYAGIGKVLYFNLSGEYCPDSVDREVGEGSDGDWLSRVVGRIKAAVSYHSVDRYHHNGWDNRGRLEPGGCGAVVVFFCRLRLGRGL